MDCRLQIAELEARLKSFEATKQELSDCQTQCERIRMALESSEAKLADAERRADEANGLIKIKDSVISKQSNFTKEIEERLRNVTEDRDRLLHKSTNLETELNVALRRGEDADELREKLKNLEELLDKLANERSEMTSESGLAAANAYFKSEQEKSESKIMKLKEIKSELEQNIEKQEQTNKELLEQINKQADDYEKLGEKCATLEARIKGMSQSDKRYGGMIGSRLIGPTLPPWIADEKKMENDLEALSKADPATLRAKVMELESEVNGLTQLVRYREDVILRIHEEIGKKASKLEAAEVERSSLSAQVSILKRELATAREDLSRKGAGPMELEAEIERLRGKRDREYQRRKRIEVELDEIEKENQELRQRVKRLEESNATAPPPKPVTQSDPSDRQRIIELQGTVNQLRMDNEAKRSELFDLRSRFDAKSAQVDKIAAELKTKERSTGELTSQLNNVRSQLEVTTKDLEAVRCRAVRGGAEVERYHAELTSLQTTNKFLSSQLNEMRSKMMLKEQLLSDLSKRLQTALSSSQNLVPIANGEIDEATCSVCGSKIHIVSSDEFADKNTDKQSLLHKEKELSEKLEEVTKMQESMEKDKLELESKLSASQLRATQLSEDVSRERRVSEAASAKIQTLTTQVNELTNTLSTTRAQLLDIKSSQRKNDAEPPILVSPPVKRTRRSAINSAKTAAANHQECNSCVELRKQVHELEGEMSDYSSREASLITQIGELRQQLVDADTNAAHLRQELSNMHEEMASKGL